MRVALVTTYSATKKEPLATLLERIHQAFLEAGIGEPAIKFSFADAPLPGFTSSVERVLKRYPALTRFESNDPVFPGQAPVRRLTNDPGSPGAGESVEFATIVAIAAGVPRSFPFHNVSIHFESPIFGAPLPLATTPIGSPLTGVRVGDSWWVNGRVRSLRALTTIDANPESKVLPALPEKVAAVLAACGKVKSTTQIPLASEDAPAASRLSLAGPNPEAARAVAAVVAEYRAGFADVFDRAALPHELPPVLEALRETRLAAATGPKKPVLVRAFKPMGYDCRGDSATFTLRRRTAGNLTVEISLDVGTWSRSLTAHFRVTGVGFRASLPLPVSKRALGTGQYPIGDAESWQKIVDNLAALVAELDRSFVPVVEAAAGPSPEWFKPES